MALLGAGLVGCQANKRPVTGENQQINPIGQPEATPPEQNPEPMPEPTPIPQQNITSDSNEVHRLREELHQRDEEIARLRSEGRPGAHRRAHGAAPKLDGLAATYNADEDTLTVVVPGRILFAPGSAKVKSEAHGMLNKIASAIEREYRGHRVYVDGHTDTTPIRSSKWANNHALAAARALSVADYLMSKGIKENSIVVRSYGPINPKATKEASRRVEIVVQVR